MQLFWKRAQVAGQGLLAVRIAKVQEKNFLFEKFRLLLKWHYCHWWGHGLTAFQNWDDFNLFHFNKSLTLLIIFTKDSKRTIRWRLRSESYLLSETSWLSESDYPSLSEYQKRNKNMYSSKRKMSFECWFWLLMFPPFYLF